MNVMANGWGSREESRLAHRRVPTTPKPEENSLPLSAIVQSDDQTVDAKALAFPGNPEQITGSKRDIVRLGNLVLEAMTNLKESEQCTIEEWLQQSHHSL
ncbi:hypothetical protein PVL29_022532 [Vitis rotundifolia]|uniref:Uncharacterized protein n=1 Tax=Vitis rotundifolia TaxID=103349 RepID=A0AA38YW88_VITRO|nr:hypothetical protein PVL29_022532 [Vitis rotundifolia]